MEEDLFTLIESCRLNFTYVEELLADYFLSKKPAVTIDKLAQNLAVSKSSITRFCKKIGLNNYKELVFLYKLSLNHAKTEDLFQAKVTASYHELATKCDYLYDEKITKKVCLELFNHKVIHFLGKGFNSYAGLDFEFKFTRLGKIVKVVNDGKSIKLAASLARYDELIIVSTLRGEDEDLMEAMKLAKNRQIPMVLLTANKLSELVNYTNLVLFVPSLKDDESFGNISPQIPILMELDIIYECYSQMYTDVFDAWQDAENLLHDNY